MISCQKAFSSDRPRKGELAGHLIKEEGAREWSTYEIIRDVNSYLLGIDLSRSDDLSEQPTIWVQFRASDIFVKALWPGDLWPEDERQSLSQSFMICRLILTPELDEDGKTDGRKTWSVFAEFGYKGRPTLSSLDMVPPPADNSHAVSAP